MSDRLADKTRLLGVVFLRLIIRRGSAFLLRLINRAESIGVNVNETSSETAIANDEAKRGHKAAGDAAHKSHRHKDGKQRKGRRHHGQTDFFGAFNCRLEGGMFFSSMKRKMFSRTTMASSITMPTIRVRASIVIWFSVNPIAAIKPKVAISDVGIARAAIKVERKLQRKMKTTMAARMLPSISAFELIRWTL